MLPLPDPYLNGIRITHEELRAIHANMRVAVHAATKERCLAGPRLLFPDRGERYCLKAHKRDRDGNLLASVTVYLPWSGAPYVRRFRLVRERPVVLRVDASVARA
jgi:hypothetical protein